MLTLKSLKKLDLLTKERLKLVNYLNDNLKDIEGIKIPVKRNNSTHVYYRYALKIDLDRIRIKAPLFASALNAEGMDFYVGYMRPLYLQPLYQNKILYGDKGCPFTCPYYKGNVDYSKGICPNAELLEDIVISTEIVRPPQTIEDMDDIIYAIKKVLSNKDELLKRYPREG